MKNIKTNYLGLELKNPLIVGACNFATSLENAEKVEKAGASAIVYKSLFEEQVLLDKLKFQQELEEYNDLHAEMTRIFPNLEHAGTEEHLYHLEKVKKNLSIPVIGSLNATHESTWLEYAQSIQQTGVDALELNFYAVPMDIHKMPFEIESEIINTVNEIKSKIKIPVSVKLGPYFTNILNIVHELDKTGIEGLVLFNNFFHPDIDIHNQLHILPYQFSFPPDSRLPLRYAGLLYGNIEADICSNTGIHSSKDLIKVLLAGADCVQVVSTIYKHGLDILPRIIADLEEWMDQNQYSSLDDFRGKLSKKELKDPYAYKRAQYVDILMHTEFKP